MGFMSYLYKAFKIPYFMHLWPKMANILPPNSNVCSPVGGELQPPATASYPGVSEGKDSNPSHSILYEFVNLSAVFNVLPKYVLQFFPAVV